MLIPPFPVRFRRTRAKTQPPHCVAKPAMTHAARASLPPDPPLRLRVGRRDGASRSDQGAKADAATPAAELSVLAEDSRRRHRFPDTGGTRGWLRQGRRGGG